MSKDQIKKKNYTVHNDDKNVLAFRFVLVFFLFDRKNDDNESKKCFVHFVNFHAQHV
jgi:hypothetical protein